MSLPVFHHPDLTAAVVGGSVELGGDEARHAVVVRRTRVGEQVALTDGAGTTVVVDVAATTKSSLTGSVVSVDHDPAETPRLVVVQAIPKGDRGELAVEVLTEVGADVVVPWAASRSVAVWRGERAAKSLAKWRSTAREAAKQARRSWWPEVREMAGTSEVVDLLEERYAEFDGLNLSFETREGILKHCSRRDAQGLEAAEPGGVGRRFLDGTEPSLEARLTNLADEIAYNAHDIDDGVRSGLLTLEQLDEVPMVQRWVERVVW